MENVLGFSDSFISCNRDDMALFKVETHFPFLCPFVECVKVFLECSCVYLRLKSYIHYGVISKESNCRSNIVWNVVNVKLYHSQIVQCILDMSNLQEPNFVSSICM